MPQVHHVKKARKNYKEHGIKKGEPYYWWKFRYGGKQFSKKPPKPAQLTQSGFLQAIYDIEQRLSNLSLENIRTPDDLMSMRDEIVNELEQLRDEQEEKRDNMPEQLQDSSSAGELLQERYESLDSWINELNEVDCDVDGFDEMKDRDEKDNALEERILQVLSCKYQGS